MAQARAHKFSRIITTVPRVIADPFGAALVELGAGAIEERPTRHADTVEIVLSLPAGEVVEPWQGVMRSLYQAFAEELSVPLDAFTMRVEQYELDYHDGWLRHLTLVQLTPNLVLAPENDRTPSPDGCQRLVFMPQPSFGDGTHVTTQLAARALELLLTQPFHGRLLDVGTGNGVLCLVAAHYGMESVGIDIDPQAVECAKVNAEKNHLQALCHFETTKLEELSERFDLVVANLEPRTQLDVAHELIERVAPSGTLLLTGFLREQAAEVARAYETKGYVVTATTAEGDFILLSLRSPETAPSEGSR